MRKLVLCFLAGGKINDQPKCLIKTPKGTHTLEEILNIFNQINYQEYGIKVEKKIILYPANNKEQFQKLVTDEELIEAGNKLTETIHKAISSLNQTQEDSFICFIATDTPLINYESIEDIIKRFSLLEGDIFYPFVSQEVYRVKFGPKLTKRRTFIKLNKDSFCGTGIIIIKKQTLLKIWDTVNKILENRKNPLKIAQILNLDPITLLKLIIGKLTVLELEKKINEIFGIKAQGMLTNFANLAFNIDTPQDLQDYSQIIKNKTP
ncbi:MAG: hypothetical protein RMJ51_00900 [Candidatus Calescibacterium sp.]|nr:hypothetical protein [Candidatus Calescibacterium sp.]MCX7972103.1 hypothetical protein [bacterium]MDW8194791.1 hypothetical protein [Candidatus Calescibacterium sp.]